MIEKLSKHLFWDMDWTKLDQRGDADLIIERVFKRGSENDEREIFKFYGRDKIRDIVMKTRYFDARTLNYLSIILNTPQEDFACYERSKSPNPFGIDS